MITSGLGSSCRDNDNEQDKRYTIFKIEGAAAEEVYRELQKGRGIHICVQIDDESKNPVILVQKEHLHEIIQNIPTDKKGYDIKNEYH